MQSRFIDDSGLVLPLMEEFYTIQGEGFHTGKAAYFIRLGGCDVGCHWCDVKESWNPEMHPPTPIEDIINKIEKLPAKSVVVTGGEPLLYNLTPLTTKLKESNIQTFIETSGSYPLSGKWDWICVSPKKFKAPRPEILNQAGELKVIIFNKSDFQWAEKHAKIVASKTKLYLQPEWSKQIEMLPYIIEYVKNNPKWEISLQTHKFMNIP